MHLIGLFASWLAFVAGLCFAGEQDVEDDSFVGWRGATYDAKRDFGYGFTEPVQVSEKPLAYVWKNFISRDEAKHVAQLALPHLRRSLVGDGQKSDNIRTSYGCFIPRYQTEVIAAIEERVAKWTGLPVINQESMQVLRYSEGQRYKPHMDAHGRMATILIYLSDTTVGGETAFPNTTDDHWLERSLKPEGLSADCAEGHVAVKPEIGTALLFYSMPPGAEADESLRVVDTWALHTGCPPAEGQLKWTSTIWVRAEPFRPEDFSKDLPKPPMMDAALCKNFDKRCEHWAATEQCEKAKGYMLGEGNAPPHCLRACGACTLCEDGDAGRECRIANRERLGFLGDLEAEVAQLFPEQQDSQY